MAEAECMNCGDSFYPEDSFSDHICNFCHYQECIDCGVEHYSSDNKSACTDCLNNPDL